MKTYHLDPYTKVNFDLRIQLATVVFLQHDEPQALFIAPTVDDEYCTAAAYVSTNGDPVKIAVEQDGEWILTEDANGETFRFPDVEISMLESPLRWERERLAEWEERVALWYA